MAVCQVDAALTADGAQLCSQCAQRLAVGLADVVWLAEELQIVRVRQTRYVAHREGARSTETPVPWDDRASRMLVQLHAAAYHWVRQIGGDDVAVVTETVPLARWLLRNMPILCHHGEAGQAYRDLILVIDKAKTLVDRPPDRVAYGMCGYTGPNGNLAPCHAYLYAGPDEEAIECPRCKAVFDVETRRRWMLEHVNTMLGTASEVATYLGIAGITVTPGGIRAMMQRKRLFPVNPHKTDREDYIFRFRDVIEAAQTKYQRK